MGDSAARFASAVVAGKFWPPHAGHDALIRFAGEHARRVTVVVCDDPAQAPAAGSRAGWLQQTHAYVDVVVVPDICAGHWPEPCEPQCSQRWAEHLRACGLGPFDVVCSSEPYGDLFARALDATHLCFDAGRELHPVSATEVRDDLVRVWSMVNPAARAGMCRRVVVLGAESTGTTTLARDLAAAIGAPLTHEAGRVVSWAHTAQAGRIDDVVWSERDFWQIAHTQVQLEAAAAATAARQLPGRLGPWVVCDTDLVATAVWWERYLGVPNDALVSFAAANLADVYLVTSPDGVEFHQDGVRDGEDLRMAMHTRFCSLLDRLGATYTVVSGSPDARLGAALAAVADVGPHQWGCVASRHDVGSDRQTAGPGAVGGWPAAATVPD